jgi:hypothetical protein
VSISIGSVSVKTRLVIAAVTGIVTATVSPEYVTAAVVDESISLTASPQSISMQVKVVPLTTLDPEAVTTTELVQLEISPEYADTLAMSDSDEKEVDTVLTDTVTVAESLFKAVTNPIDFDPSDDDVDPTPVTMADAIDSFDVDKPLTDTTTISELAALDVGISPSDNLASPTDAIDDFNVGKVATDAVTTAEAIDRFDVTTEFDDAVTISESTAKDFTHGGFTDSVAAVESSIKVFNSSVDFDPSDADVDPDPITPSDQIDTFDINKAIADALSATESDEKTLTRPDVSDSVAASESASKDVTKPAVSDAVTAVEGIKNNPQIVKTDSATVTEAITKFDPRLTKTDSVATSEAIDEFDVGKTLTDSASMAEAIDDFDVGKALTDTTNTPTDAIDEFDVGKVLTDTISVTEVLAKNFTEVVDYDRTDADADADPVTATDSPALSTTKPGITATVSMSESAAKDATKPGITDTVSMSESSTLDIQLAKSDNIATPYDAIGPFVVDAVYTDAITVTESINTSLVLGESDYLYPDYVVASDGDSTFRYADNNGSVLTPDTVMAVGQHWSILNDTYIRSYNTDAAYRNRQFVQQRRLTRVSRYADQLAGSSSQLNSALLWGLTSDSFNYENYTNVIGGAGVINEPMLLSEYVTYPDTSGAGLVVRFHYTDTDDRTLGGHNLNETPIL